MVCTLYHMSHSSIHTVITEAKVPTAHQKQKVIIHTVSTVALQFQVQYLAVGHFNMETGGPGIEPPIFPLSHSSPQVLLWECVLLFFFYQNCELPLNLRKLSVAQQVLFYFSLLL